MRLRLGRRVARADRVSGAAGRPLPVDSRSNDRWFQHVAIIVRDMDRRTPGSAGSRCSTPPPGRSGCRRRTRRRRHPRVLLPRSRSPLLEVLQFPPGQGRPKWHAPTDRLFLGIDHTAIVVGRHRASLAFYRDTLGFRVAGESENFGTEQEHLNNVRGARLRITGLRAAAGPGIEFLEYLAPRDGRPYPADERPNDLVHWQTTVSVRCGRGGSPSGAGTSVWSPRRPSSCPIPARLPAWLLVRDPDGHVVQLLEEQGEVHAQH